MLRGFDRRGRSDQGPNLTRRRVALLVASIPALPLAIADPSPSRCLIARHDFLAELSAWLPGAAALGDAYLKSEPQDGDFDELWLRLFGGGDAINRESGIGLLSTRIAADFGQLDTVLVHGIVMARSEARICALVSLSCGHAHQPA